jgi:hypothetical protein
MRTTFGANELVGCFSANSKSKVNDGVAEGTGVKVAVGSSVAVGCGVGVSVGADVGVGEGGTGVTVSVAVGIETTTVSVGAAGDSTVAPGAAAAPTGVCVKVGTGVRVGLSPWLHPLLMTSSREANSTQHHFAMNHFDFCRCFQSLPQFHLPWLCGLPNVTCPLLEHRVEVAIMLADVGSFCKDSRLTMTHPTRAITYDASYPLTLQ